MGLIALPPAEEFDVAKIREGFRLLALHLHCSACEVEWHGGGPCWSCGWAGSLGALPYSLAGGEQ